MAKCNPAWSNLSCTMHAIAYVISGIQDPRSRNPHLIRVDASSRLPSRFFARAVSSPFFNPPRPHRSSSIVIDHRRWLRIRNESLTVHRQRQKDEPSLPFFRNQTTLPSFGPPSLLLTPSLPSLCWSLLTPRLLPPTPTANGTNNGVKFIRLHIGTIKRQTDRQPSEQASRQWGSTKEGLILNIIYLCRRKSEGGAERAPSLKTRTTDKLCPHRGSIQSGFTEEATYMYLFQMKKDMERSSNLDCRKIKESFRNFRQQSDTSAFIPVSFYAS